MKTILLPTDFSEYAWNALITAMKLFDNDARYVLIHVYEPRRENLHGFKSTTRAGTTLSALGETAQKKLDMVYEAVEKISPEKVENISTMAIAGSLVQILNTMVQQHDADLIVMGTQGATGAKKIFMGSNTVRTIKGIDKCPILVVPQKFNLQKLDKIVFPTDFTHFYDKNSLQFLKLLISKWNSKILVFHVAEEFKLNDVQITNKKILTERLQESDFSFHKVNIRSTVSDAIQEFADAQVAKMIVLMRHRHTFLEKLTQEPVVNKMAFETSVPLLVLPA